ncbi:MAG TPA: Asp-tRNA(Asn)/Glu-tRNA(Gln) amidotransferase subunit GatB [Candidatus Aenigmarchaeota archaeon]|nr:Asp-tRNA(Asn)/Glu-tRNA(Gln) amidotransferase subunit GatB [Candidatus Aenigmarchaeota archaeon]
MKKQKNYLNLGRKIKNMEEIKIGLEVHTQLNTESKLFCSCSTSQTEPNKNVCDVCLGMPGTKPVLNEKSIELALKIAFALDAKINHKFLFSRKTYFYPDLAKNFQITQYEIPIAHGGKLKIRDKIIRIKRIHIEEDPAKIIRKDNYILLDYNRSGIPLVEIVTEPDLKSPAEARIFLQTLQQLLEFIYVVDFSREGAMRIDVNISITRYKENYKYGKGLITEKKEGARVEIKNISGAKEVEKALSYEILRQKNLRKVKRETRLWNEKTKITISAREKEEEEDYGYIFEPDLPKIEISEELLNKVSSNLPELPETKRKRFLKYSISKELVNTLLTEPELSYYFDYLCETHNPKVSAVILAKYLKKTLNYHNLKLKEINLDLKYLRRILDLLQEYLITSDIAEIIIQEMVGDYIKGREIRSPDKILKDLKYEKPLEEDKIRRFVIDVVRNNQKAVKDYLSGKKEALDYLVGQVMRKISRREDAKKVRELLKREIE